jgi:hypothetical protein
VSDASTRREAYGGPASQPALVVERSRRLAFVGDAAGMASAAKRIYVAPELSARRSERRAAAARQWP